MTSRITCKFIIMFNKRPIIEFKTKYCYLLENVSLVLTKHGVKNCFDMAASDTLYATLSRISFGGYSMIRLLRKFWMAEISAGIFFPPPPPPPCPQTEKLLYQIRKISSNVLFQYFLTYCVKIEDNDNQVKNYFLMTAPRKAFQCHVINNKSLRVKKTQLAGRLTKS